MLFMHCDVETNYIGVQATPGDVIRYHADGKQSFSFTHVLLCFLLSQGRLSGLGVLSVSNTLWRVFCFFRDVKFMSLQRVSLSLSRV